MTNRRIVPMIWFACYTSSQSEATADFHLRQAGYETLYLRYRDQIRHARRTRDVIRPYFPRYLFVALDPSQGLYRASKAQGVSHIITANSEPVVIPGGVIEELRGRGKDGLIELQPAERKLRKRLQKGDKVRIEHGSLTGLLGTVIFDSGPSVKLWVERMKVFVHSEQLSPARAAR